MEETAFLLSGANQPFLNLESAGHDILKDQVPVYRGIRDRRNGKPPPTHTSYFVKSYLRGFSEKEVIPVKEKAQQMQWVKVVDPNFEKLAANWKLKKDKPATPYRSNRETGEGFHFPAEWCQ